MTGKFIVFEGGEGSGKTSHCKAVADKLRNDGHDVLETREPGGSSIGLKIRDIVLHDYSEPLNYRAELLLFLANRAQHVHEVILPAIKAGKIVLCDRFSGSTFAYQLGGRQLPDPAFVKKIDDYARAGLEPDAVIYLDVTAEEGLRRRQTDITEITDRLDKESIVFHVRVRDYFLELATQTTWHTVNTMTTMAEVEKKVLAVAKTVIQ